MKTEWKKKIKLNLKTIIALGMITYIFLALAGVFVFTIGFHSVDLGQNIRFINAEHGLELKDWTGSVWIDEYSLMNQGFKYMFTGFAITVYSLFAVGFLLSCLIDKYEVDKK